MNIAKSLWRQKTLWEKEKLFVTSNFSITNRVVQRLLRQERINGMWETDYQQLIILIRFLFILDPPGWLSGERVRLMTWWLWVRDPVEANVLSSVFCLPLTSAEACEKSSWWLWKESCVSTGVRKPGNMCVTDRHDMTLADKMALTHYQTTNFRLFQTERVCRRQFQMWRKWQKVIQMGRKHCEKRRNCSSRAISPFPTVFSFSKGLFPRGVKRCHCVGMG